MKIKCLLNKKMPVWLVTLAYFGLATSSPAQENIYDLEYEKHDFSIIREQTTGNWIIAKTYSWWVRFLKTSATGGTAQVIDIGVPMEVLDMELSGNGVYFCGRLRVGSSDDSKAIMGWFNTSQAFSNGNINYIVVDSIKSFNKLELYTVSQTFHVAMTGTLHDGTGCVVDALKDAELFTGWTVYWGALDLPSSYTYDGIAATSTMVTVSASQMGTTAGYLCHFEKPGMRAMPFFGNDDATMTQLAAFSQSPILLEACLQDTLYAACKGTRSCNIYKYSGELLLHQRKIPFNLLRPGIFSVVDLRKDKNSKDVHLLTMIKPASSVYYNSEIWHITPSLMSSGGNVQSHTYPDHLLSSIDYRRTGTNGVIASGALGYNTLSLYRLQANTWGSCTGSHSNTFSEITGWYPVLAVGFSRQYQNIGVQVMNGSVETSAITISCP